MLELACVVGWAVKGSACLGGHLLPPAADSCGLVFTVEKLEARVCGPRDPQIVSIGPVPNLAYLRQAYAHLTWTF